MRSGGWGKSTLQPDPSALFRSSFWGILGLGQDIVGFRQDWWVEVRGSDSSFFCFTSSARVRAPCLPGPLMRLKEKTGRSLPLCCLPGLCSLEEQGVRGTLDEGAHSGFQAHTNGPRSAAPLPPPSLPWFPRAPLPPQDPSLIATQEMGKGWGGVPGGTSGRPSLHSSPEPSSLIFTVLSALE